VLLGTALLLLRLALPGEPSDFAAWLDAEAGRVGLALGIMPFAGIAFLWFIGVLRDRLGSHEDRFFATVFLGSGFLFLAMLFVGAASIGAMIMAHQTGAGGDSAAATFALWRAFTFVTVNVYAIKMAAVFMIVTSTLALLSGFTSRWLALLGYALSLPLLLGSRVLEWGFVVFPLWVLLVSLYILLDNWRAGRTAAPP
jgi:hypothetical protein